MNETNEQDPSNFRQTVLESPGQFEAGMDLAAGTKFPDHPGLRSLMISGMGGSALPGNLFRVYLNDLSARGLLSERLSIYQNRFYDLPWEARRALNVFASYSGNTEETIESFESAVAEKLPSLGISSGGKVEEICAREDLPHIKLPIPFPNFQPRSGTGYFFGALFQVLVNEGIAPDMKAEIAAGAEYLRTRLAELEERGKAVAKRCIGKTPVIYAGARYKPVAMVWKIKMNENAKTTAFWNFFPELNHNEMVGYTLPQGSFHVIMLRDPEDHPKNLKRFEITAELLRKQGTSVEILDMEGENVFNRMFDSILLADFASYALALENGVDPTPVDMVEDLKKQLVK